MKNLARYLLLICGMSIGTTALACSFDTDCNVGSKCVKQGGNLYGVCVGGLNPGNAYDRQPVYDPLDMNRGSSRTGSTGDSRKRQDSNGTYGDTCSFDLDCGVSGKCVKKSGSLYGTCM